MTQYSCQCPYCQNADDIRFFANKKRKYDQIPQYHCKSCGKKFINPSDKLRCPNQFGWVDPKPPFPTVRQFRAQAAEDPTLQELLIEDDGLPLKIFLGMPVFSNEGYLIVKGWKKECARVLEKLPSYLPSSEEYLIFNPPSMAALRQFLEENPDTAKRVENLNLVPQALERNYYPRPNGRWKVETYILMMRADVLESLDGTRYTLKVS